MSGTARTPTSSTNATAAMSPAISPADMRETLSRPTRADHPRSRAPFVDPATPPLRRAGWAGVHKAVSDPCPQKCGRLDRPQIAAAQVRSDSSEASLLAVADYPED